jgi:hypothetical protein
MPADTDETVESFIWLGAGFVGPKDSQAKLSRVKPAVRLHGNALQKKRRSYSDVHATDIGSVQLSGMFFYVRGYSSLKIVPVQTVEKVRLNAGAGPIHIARSDELQVLAGFPYGSQYAGKKPEGATAFIELLESSEPTLCGIHQPGMEGVTFNDPLGVI